MTKLLITGLYRSGTTLLSRLINNHPDAWITYDSGQLFRYFCSQKANSTLNLSRLLSECDRRYKRAISPSVTHPILISPKRYHIFTQITFKIITFVGTVSLAVLSTNHL